MRQKREIAFESQSFRKRFGSMLRVDSRRMFSSPLLYVCLLISFVIPVLILVMTTMTGDAAAAGAPMGAEAAAFEFTNAWQIIASESGAGMAGMDMSSMCNINLMYFMAGVFICLFVAQDFSSGYAKNLFTVRAGKGDYVASKTLLGFIAGALFLLAFFTGTILGGAFAGLSFDLGSAGTDGLMMCMLAKVFLMAVFAAIFVLMSVFGKRRAWLSICLSLFGGMLLFMMIPMLTPLDSGVMNVGMCLAGGAIFASSIGTVSNMILKKTDLV